MLRVRMTRVRMRLLASLTSHLLSSPSASSGPPCTQICAAGGGGALRFVGGSRRRQQALPRTNPAALQVPTAMSVQPERGLPCCTSLLHQCQRSRQISQSWWVFEEHNTRSHSVPSAEERDLERPAAAHQLGAGTLAQVGVGTTQVLPLHVRLPLVLRYLRRQRDERSQHPVLDGVPHAAHLVIRCHATGPALATLCHQPRLVWCLVDRCWKQT